LLAPDTWERHRIISRLVGEPDRLLDVGGVAGQLELFLPGTEILAANVEAPADLIYDGRRLPLADDSFAAAVSLDVLEHLDRAHRADHLGELTRVASGRVVLCCPLGTPAHVEAERELAAWYRSTFGEAHRFLEEHLERGLPTEDELRGLGAAGGRDFTLRFHGDFRRTDDLFKLASLARRRPSPRALTAYLRARLGRRGPGELLARSEPYTNRAFLIGDPSRSG
jgi:hypothetical protein